MSFFGEGDLAVAAAGVDHGEGVLAVLDIDDHLLIIKGGEVCQLYVSERIKI